MSEETRVVRNDFTTAPPADRKLIIEGLQSRLVARPDNPLSPACAFLVLEDILENAEVSISLTPDEARALSLALDRLADEHLVRSGK